MDREHVKPNLKQAARVVAYLDKLNVNVGYEVGYALGLPQTEIALCHYLDVPAWFEAQPFRGQHRGKVSNAETLSALIRNGEWRLRSAPCNNADDKLLLLYPKAGAGSVYRDCIEEQLKNFGYPSPRTVEFGHASLVDYATKLDSVGRILWVLAPHTNGPDHRDGWKIRRMRSLPASPTSPRRRSPSMDCRISARTWNATSRSGPRLQSNRDQRSSQTRSRSNLARCPR